MPNFIVFSKTESNEWVERDITTTDNAWKALQTIADHDAQNNTPGTKLEYACVRESEWFCCKYEMRVVAKKIEEVVNDDDRPTVHI